MGSEEMVSNKSLLGKFYLMDFWAVWCGPRVGEMPNLHKAYKRFHAANLEFLSLSFDARPRDVKKFRQGKWEMPWLHSFVEGGFRNEIAKKFEVAGIPKPILVSPDGTILATEGALRGKNLEETLAKFIGSEQTIKK